MKLTSELLTGVYEKSQELQRLEAVTEHAEVVEELQHLGTQIRGCIGLIDDLSVALESLHTSGYSTEWFDIINRDNNFLAVVDLDMPKFFGGDETKQAACEGAIIDTIKKWAKAIWEWIKSFYDKIKKALYWIKGLWISKNANKGELIRTWEEVQKLCTSPEASEAAQAAFKSCFGDMYMSDPDVVINYITHYEALVETVQEISDKLNLSDPAKIPAVMAMLAEYQTSAKSFSVLLGQQWSKKAVGPRAKIPVKAKDGFSLTGTNDAGADFAPIVGENGSMIARYEMGYSQYDAEKRNYWYRRTKEASIAAINLSLKLENTVTQMEKNKKTMQESVNALTRATEAQLQNASDEQLAALNNARTVLSIYGACLTVIQKIATNCIRFAGHLDSDLRKADELANKLKAALGQK